MPNSVCKIKHFNVITSWNTNVLNFRQKAYERIPLRETKNPIYTQIQGTSLNVLALAEQCHVSPCTRAMLLHEAIYGVSHSPQANFT